MNRRLDSRHRRVPFFILALFARNLAAAHAQIDEQQHQILVWRSANGAVRGQAHIVNRTKRSGVLCKASTISGGCDGRMNRERAKRMPGSGACVLTHRKRPASLTDNHTSLRPADFIGRKVSAGQSFSGPFSDSSYQWEVGCQGTLREKERGPTICRPTKKVRVPIDTRGERTSAAARATSNVPDVHSRVSTADRLRRRG